MTGSWPLVMRGAMDAVTCRRICASMDAGVTEEAEVLEGEVEIAADVRSARYVDVVDGVLDLVGRHLDAHRAAIASCHGKGLSGREGAGLLRYERGGFYRTHVDRASRESWHGAARRAVTVVLFLASSREVDSDGAFVGGHLRLYLADSTAPVEIVPEEGMLVAFPAATPHEVTPVTEGRRDAVVDWFYDG